MINGAAHLETPELMASRIDEFGGPMDETADIGRDTGSPVSDDYSSEHGHFNGEIHWVQIELGEDADDADHLIGPEERLRIVMARQ